MNHCEEVYWREQAAADVPSNETWLSPGERARLRTMRFPKRHADWLLGRWTAKNAIATYLGLSAQPKALADIEVRQQPSGAPQAFCQNELAPVSISLSHRAGLGACVVASAAVFLGCDLEIAEPHSDAFLADYFTADEQAIVGRTEPPDRVWLLALLWSAKESALKALGQGLRLDTRQLTVKFPETYGNNDCGSQSARLIIGSPFGCNAWNPMQVHKINAQTLYGCWNLTGTIVRTVIVASAPKPPPLG